jgi:hypothetical protein
MTILDDLQKEIMDEHGSRSIHLATVAVINLPEGYPGMVVVEVFDLLDHPEAETIYAWRRAGTDFGKEGEIITVLRIAPITNAKKAVWADIAALPCLIPAHIDREHPFAEVSSESAIRTG